jgi:CrcB protein
MSDHLRPRLVALVAAGGAVGTALREAVALAVAPIGPFPLSIFVINIAGAFALGLLLQVLARRGDDTGGRRLMRLGLGTGVLGGFTTYSALSTDSAHLLAEGGLVVALLYGLATVVIGLGASGLGMLAGGGRPGAPGPGAGAGPRAMPVDPDTMPDDGPTGTPSPGGRR